LAFASKLHTDRTAAWAMDSTSFLGKQM